MINRTLMVAAAGVVLILAGGLYVNSQFTKNDAEERSAVYGVVTDFGSNLKKVALYSPHAKEQIANAYKDVVTPELLAAWEESPPSAPGSITLNPWPDHLAIGVVTKHKRDYEVEADIVLLTSSETTDESEAGTIPAHMIVSLKDGKWRISRYQSP